MKTSHSVIVIEACLIGGSLSEHVLDWSALSNHDCERARAHTVINNLCTIHDSGIYNILFAFVVVVVVVVACFNYRSVKRV